jgi:selenium-binding protein 1
MALEVRPAHDPVREYGFLGVVVDTTNLEGSIWTWWREGGKFHIEKTATIPAEPAPKDQLEPVCTENLKSDHSGDEVRPGWRVN